MWPARLKVEIAGDLRVSNLKNFPSEKLLLNGFQYHAGIQQHSTGCIYACVASYLVRTYISSRLVDDLEYFDNQRPFDPMQLARLAAGGWCALVHCTTTVIL